MSFIHLHNHSHFSLLDGLSKPAQMMKRAAELDQPAIAITDHGSLSGIYQLWKESKKSGVKPIAGCEFYIAPHDRHLKEAVHLGSEDERQSDLSGSGAYGHITILADSAEGVRSLYRLQNRAYREGFYRKPRIDLDLLRDHRDGLICLTGCPGGLLSTYIRLRQPDQAKSHLGELKEIFGDKLYVEVMAHGISFEKELNSVLLDLAYELQVPSVATGDSHYTLASDKGTHSALLCVQTRSTLDSPSFQFDGSGYHLSTAEEMEQILRQANIGVLPAGRTLEVAERIGSYDSVFQRRLRMPKWHDSEEVSKVELDYRAAQWLAKTGLDGEHRKRLNYELQTIKDLGFADYFLVVADVVNDAKEQGIRVGPARGSAGGSLAAFALGITSIDPIPSGLLFERFLNPERVGLPDIDIDIQEDRRDEVLAIAREKYGEECVAQLGTFGTIAAKAALKDAARVLGHPYRAGEEATWNLPRAKFGRSPSLSEYNGDRDTDIYQVAVGLEGTVRSESVHAAAVVVAPQSLQDQLPLRLQGGKGDWVTAYDMHEVEELGFVKTDILGLRTLKVIDDCLRMLGTEPGTLPGLPTEPDVCTDVPGARQVQSVLSSVQLPTDPRECADPATYELLSRGDTLGVFQLDSSGMRGLLRQVVPDRFEDISAVLALYRPGPMGVKADRDYAQRKHGRQWVSYPHPELAKALEPILRNTYGLIVYQEQVLEVLAAVGGYTYGSAELIFNAMRKKQHEKMQAAYPDFSKRMEERGYSADAIEALWETLVPFADYSFNKSHSTGYGIVAYWTAYLKANYPSQWMAALLSNEPDPEKLKEYLHECARMQIPVLPPDVNDSGITFTPTDEGIRYGLAAIKGVGEKALTGIIGRRPYRNLADYLSRVPAAGLNSGVVGALVHSGAFDRIVPSREGLAATIERHIEKASSERKAKKKGQRGVVGPQYRIPKEAISLKQRRKWERETIGVPLSYGTLHLVPTSPLSEPELVWIKEALERCPGSQRSVLDFSGNLVSTGCRVEPELVERALAPLGKIKMEER